MFRARRLPVHRGPAAWNAILPPPPAPRPVEGDASVDVAVIGAGFAGLSAARRLIQLDPSLKIAVLDAGRIGEGASGRNSGFMIDLPHDLTSEHYAGSAAERDRTMTRLNRSAIVFAREAVEEYGICADYFDPVGKVNGAASEGGHRANENYAEHLDQLNETYEKLDAEAMHALTGSRRYVSGLYTPGTVMLQPAGYVRGLAAGLTRDGLLIHENAPVTSFAKMGNGWQISTPRGSVAATRIILANNGHLESFGFKAGRLMHIFLFATMTKELDEAALKALGGRPRWGVTPSDPMGTTFRRIDTGQGGNRIVTRTCAVFRPDMETTAAQMAHARRVMRRKFDARFSQIAGYPVEYEWSGHVCLSWNGVSVAHELEEGVFSACVQNGLGAARGTLTGIAAAEQAMGATSPISDFFKAEAEPDRLPPEPFASIGANVYLRWKEWRAGKE